MKKIILAFLALFPLTLSLSPAFAADILVAQTMQRCTTNEECALVTNSCADNCAYVPVNRSNLTALGGLYQSRCGKPMDANPQCVMNPPIAAACVNARCTIDYAYANNAGPKDYKAGAYAVPEAPVPDKVPGDYSGVNDKKGGFSAYNLPQEDVRQNTVGQIVNKVYVPPSAPVSGGNYVPVNNGSQPPKEFKAAPAPNNAPAPQPITTAPAAAVPVVPPVAVPTNKSYATPPVAVPAVSPVYPAPTPAPAPVAPPAPAPAPKPAAAAQTPYEYVVPETPPVVQPQPAVPQKQVPSFAGTPRAPSIPAVDAPGVPLAPPGSIPIPPSDLKPAPTFVPPPGTPSMVSPEDPGAPPPPGTTLIAPTKDGNVTLGTQSFGGIPAKKSTAAPDLN